MSDAPSRIRGRIVKTIMFKELREALRDRRTLFLMILLPIILYPLLMIIVVQVAAMQQAKLAAKPSQVGLLGATEHHPLGEALHADELIEITLLDTLPEKPSALDLDLVIDLSAWPAELDESQTASAAIRFESVEDTSRQAKKRVETHLEAVTHQIVQRRLEAAGLQPKLLEPVDVASVDTSEKKERGGFLLGSILPILVIVTVLLGAFYPAIDLTAGEKERGSIQTLFTAPITSFEIVAGKYFAVLIIAILSGMANLLSMGLIFSQGFLGNLGDALGQVDFSLSAGTIAILFINILAIALFFSALLLTVAILARSFKEAQNYLTPVYLVCIIPAMVAQMPGFELTPQLALVPAVNVILLMKEVLITGVRIELLFLVVASSLIYTTLILLLASRLFAQERVVLGDRGSFNILAAPSDIRPKERPSISEGLAAFGLMFLLLFYGGGYLQGNWPRIGLIVSLWLLLLTPTLGLSRYLKLDLRETFHLRVPSNRTLLGAALLGLSAWTGVLYLSELLEEFVLTPPPELEAQMEALFPPPRSIPALLELLFIAAVTPAICEEFFFRGFLFSSLRGRIAPWAVILLSAALFGLLHMSIYRLFGTTLLGVFMGLVVWKSGSILTSVLFHFCNNAIALLVAFHFGDTLPNWVLLTGGVMTVLGLALLWGARSPWHEPQDTPGVDFAGAEAGGN